MTGRPFAVLALIVESALFALAACAQEPEPTATNVPFDPTPAGQEPTPSNGGQTPGPDPTATQPPAEGDPERGQQVFNSQPCSGCHNTSDQTLVGPGLAGVGTRAETRTELSADEYLRQSIREPGAYVVEGFGNIMPPFAGLPEQDVNDLVAYLKTLE